MERHDEKEKKAASMIDRRRDRQRQRGNLSYFIDTANRELSATHGSLSVLWLETLSDFSQG